MNGRTAEHTVRVRLLNSKQHTTPLYNNVPNTGSTSTRKSESNSFNVSVKNCTLAFPVFSVCMFVATRYFLVYLAHGRSMSMVVFAIPQLIFYQKYVCILYRGSATLQIGFNQKRTHYVLTERRKKRVIFHYTKKKCSFLTSKIKDSFQFQIFFFKKLIVTWSLSQSCRIEQILLNPRPFAQFGVNMHASPSVCCGQSCVQW